MPKGGGEPPAALKQKIEASFGTLDACKKELATAAMAQFGSGWVWLVLDGGKLKVVKTGNADVPMTTCMRLVPVTGREPPLFRMHSRLSRKLPSFEKEVLPELVRQKTGALGKKYPAFETRPILELFEALVYDHALLPSTGKHCCYALR